MISTERHANPPLIPKNTKHELQVLVKFFTERHHFQILLFALCGREASGIETRIQQKTVIYQPSKLDVLGE
jgi:hypothetical protein